MKGMLKGATFNKKVIPHIRAEIWHCGMNDYRVVIAGIGTYAKVHQMNPAFVKARWIAELDQESMDIEIAKIKSNIEQEPM